MSYELDGKYWLEKYRWAEKAIKELEGRVSIFERRSRDKQQTIIEQRSRINDLEDKIEELELKLKERT